MIVLTAPRYLHFFLLPVVIQIGLYFGAFLGFTVLIYWFFSRFEFENGLRYGIWLMTAHFTIWLLFYSWFGSRAFLGFFYLSDRLSYVLFLGISILSSVGFFLFLQYLSRFFREDSISTRVLVILSIFVLVVRLSVVFTPLPWVSQVVVLPNPVRVVPNTWLYPFSKPLISAIEDYKYLLPAVPQGEKIFVVVLDAFRADFLGKRLKGKLVTPTLSRMAEQHLYFPNYRVQAPNTKASVASFFTGRYVREHATYAFGPRDSMKSLMSVPQKSREKKFYGQVLPADFKTLAERLDEVGFSNGGVYSMLHLNPRFQYDQGFDFYVSSHERGTQSELFSISSMIFWLLKRQPEKAFFYLHFSGAHFPYSNGVRNKSFWRSTPYYRDGGVVFENWDLPEIETILQEKLPESVDIKNRPEYQLIRYLYASDLNYYDQYVIPTFFKVLDSLNVRRQSLITITSDHGEDLYDHNRFFGHGENLYDESIKVPLILDLPDSLPQPDLRSDTRINLETVDLTASLLDYAGAPPDRISGKPFPPFQSYEGSVPDYHRTSFSEKALDSTIQKIAVVQGSWKMIYNYWNNSSELYNLKRDSQERDPLGDHSRKKAQLMNLIRGRFGKNNQLKRDPSRLKFYTEQGAQNLKGLGYFD